ncbi:uncharacterized protein VTP21DRAFT_11038 [Calcarisporiella thermophila]|uniref:uncharacterized protein n=1 Tax=Calcarisporiella thermophila TaxID=911321 RepID=UPI003743017E
MSSEPQAPENTGPQEPSPPPHAAEPPERAMSETSSIVEEHDFREGGKSVFEKPFYRHKRYWVICLIITIILLAIFIPLIIFVFFPLITQSILNSANLSVDEGNITSPEPSSFALSMNALFTNTGPFAASIDFTRPVQVSWNDTLLGSFSLPPVSVSGGSGVLNATTNFQIVDPTMFAKFIQNISQAEEFVWHLSSSANAKALGLSANNLKIEKAITLKGLNGLKNTTILSLELPSDDPAGGARAKVATKIINPSPLGVQLGNIKIDMSYNGIFLGQTEASGVFLGAGTNYLNLTGRLIPHNNTAELDELSNMFSDYVGGRLVYAQAVIADAKPDGVNKVLWLTEGLKTTTLNASLQIAPLNLIQNVGLRTARFEFSPQTPYSPLLSSNNVSAAIANPFGIAININEVKQNISIARAGFDPLADVMTDFGVAVPGGKPGDIMLSIPPSPLKLRAGKEAEFEDLLKNLTLGNSTMATLAGNATAKINISIGQLTLKQVKFSSNVTLYGLQGLKNPPPVISGIDLVGGTPEGLDLVINSSITNPSNLEIALNSDVLLRIDYQNIPISNSTLIRNLTLRIGPNELPGYNKLDVNATPQGKDLLEKFLAGTNNTVLLGGLQDSTQIVSINPAFSLIGVDVILPGLKDKLLKYGMLRIHPETPETTIATAIVVMANPFTATLDLTKIVATIDAYGVPLGFIDVERSSNPLRAIGKSDSFLELPVRLNLDPSALIVLFRQSAKAKGLDLTQLDTLLELGGIKVEDSNAIPISRRLARRNIFDGFNIVDFTKSAIKTIPTDNHLEATSNIGSYTSTFRYNQSDVIVKTDDSVVILLPIVGNPIVQTIVNNAKLNIESVLITDPTNSRFKAHFKGSITNVGPFSAKIHLNKPLTISWKGKKLVSANLPDITSEPDVGAIIDVDSDATILDVAANEEFTKALLNEATFDWQIYAEDISVTALGFTFSGIYMDKSVSLKGFNGLREGTAIKNFDVPGLDPAGGFHTDIVVGLNNPSNVGMRAQGLNFNAYFNGILLAEFGAKDQVILPLKPSELHLSGRLLPQTSQEGLESVSKVVNNLLTGADTPLTGIGVDAFGPEGRVDWLSSAFQSLKLELILPGIQNFNALNSISLLNTELVLTKETAYSPIFSSTDVFATFSLPFNVPVDITQNAPTFTARYMGRDMASIKSGYVPVVTDPRPGGGSLHTILSPAPLMVLPGSRDLFNKFLTQLTVSASVELEFIGTIDLVANSAVGVLTLYKLPVQVKSSIPGLQGLVARPSVIESVDVVGGTRDTLMSETIHYVYNPSNNTATLGDISLDVLYEDAKIGYALIKGFKVVPGLNRVQVSLGLTAKNGGNFEKLVALLNAFISNQQPLASVKGTTSSTDIESLKEAVSQLVLSSKLPAVSNLVALVKIRILLSTLLDRIAQASVVINNQFSAPISILTVDGKAFYRELYLGYINVDLQSRPLIAPGKSNFTSPFLPLNFELLRHPLQAIKLVLYLVQDSGVVPGPLKPLLDSVLNLSFFQKRDLISEDQEQLYYHLHDLHKRGLIGELVSVVGRILDALKVDLQLNTKAQIGEFVVPLSIVQRGVPARLDDTLFQILQMVVGPVMQGIADTADIKINQAIVSNIQPGGFQLSFTGEADKVPPLPATFHFTSPVFVSWQGRQIGFLPPLPDIESKPFSGASFTVQTIFQITDPSAFQDFQNSQLQKPGAPFTWHIESEGVQIIIFGFTVNNILMRKEVLVNGLYGLVSPQPQDMQAAVAKSPQQNSVPQGNMANSPPLSPNANGAKVPAILPNYSPQKPPQQQQQQQQFPLRPQSNPQLPPSRAGAPNRDAQEPPQSSTSSSSSAPPDSGMAPQESRHMFSVGGQPTSNSTSTWLSLVNGISQMFQNVKSNHKKR